MIACVNTAGGYVDYRIDKDHNTGHYTVEVWSYTDHPSEEWKMERNKHQPHPEPFPTFGAAMAWIASQIESDKGNDDFVHVVNTHAASWSWPAGHAFAKPG